MHSLVNWRAKTKTLASTLKHPMVIATALGAGLITLVLSDPALAQEAAQEAEKIITWEEYAKAVGITDAASVEGTPMGSATGFPVDYLWTVVAGILVFFMQAGFSLVEAGFTRAKNVVNIMMKNLMDFSIGTITFWFIGFGIMFGASDGWFGTTNFFVNDVQGENGNWTFAFLFFQTVFAATAATIVSGAMAERTKFTGYLAYSVLITALIYPVFGSWAWGGLYDGGGWLEAGDGSMLAEMGLPGFIDFAGSTVVHSVGGWAALAGAIVIGPRLGKFSKTGEARPIRGHSMSLAALGVFILWMGWFGFNAGSTTGVTGGGGMYDGAGKAFALIAVNTNLAAAAGSIIAMITSWKTSGKPDIGMSLNGALAGLVTITAGCANVSPLSAVIAGGIGGAIVVGSVHFFDKIKIDDPVGAVSVHGVCGAWGTLAAGLFNAGGFSGAQIATQLVGIVAAFLWTFTTAFIVFKVIKATIGLRVSEEDEIEGLDISEHGTEGYPNDVVSALATSSLREEEAPGVTADATS